MITKGTKLYSVLHEKCPRCQEGDLFVSAPYHLTQFSKMNKTCSHCGMRFGDEPSYFFGAMYVSYAFQVMIITASYLLLRFTLHPEAGTYVTVSLLAIVLTIPISFRSARSIWINLFESYKGEPGGKATGRV